MRKTALAFTFLVYTTMALALCCEGDCKVENPDNGRIEVFPGTEARPVVLPWYVCVNPYDSEIQLPAMSAIGQWQQWSQQDGVPRDWFLVMDDNEERCNQLELGQVSIRVDVPVNDYAYAEASLEYNAFGEIVSCDIVVDISWSWAGDEWLTLWITHELGHCLGLEHDPDGLGSIMEATTPMGATLTDHDFSLLIGG